MIAAMLILAVSAAAAWKEYPLPQLGFVVEFPADPTSSTGSYRTILVPSATTHIYSLKEDHAIYVATAVDLMDHKDEGANILGEAEFNLTMLGDVTGTTPQRVEPGRAAVWGRFITVDCRSSKLPDQPGQTDAARAWFKGVTGVECPDHSRLMSNIFFNLGRLYLIQGINLPSTEDNSFGPLALRFANSVSFFAKDGTRNAADLAR
jgi:hypothetical protein